MGSKREERFYCDTCGRTVEGIDLRKNMDWVLDSPWKGHRIEVGAFVREVGQRYRSSAKELCEICRAQVQYTIFKNPIQIKEIKQEALQEVLTEEAEPDCAGTGSPAASGVIFPLAETFKETNPRLVYVALLLLAASGYIWYLTFSPR